jgi:hypothetical protein
VLHVKCFDFLPSSAFLCILTQPVTTENGLKVSEANWVMFRDLSSKEVKPKLFKAIKALNKRMASKGEMADD